MAQVRTAAELPALISRHRAMPGPSLRRPVLISTPSTTLVPLSPLIWRRLAIASPLHVMDDVGMDWTQRGLQNRGFRGFVRFRALPDADVPNVTGVYAVVRPTDSPPAFLARSPAGHFKGRDPTVDSTGCTKPG